MNARRKAGLLLVLVVWATSATSQTITRQDIVEGLRGEAYDWEWQPKKAEALYRRILAIQRSAYGERHEEVAHSLADLAEMLEAQQRLREAEELLRQAVRIDRALRQRGLFSSSRLWRLAMNLTAQGRLKDAERVWREALINHRRGTTDYALGLRLLGENLSAQKRFPAAERVLRRAVGVAEQQSDDSLIPAMVASLADCLEAQDKLREAEALRRRAVAVGQANHGEKHTGASTSVENLAKNLEAQRRYVDAEPWRRLLIEMYAPYKHLGAGSHLNLALNLHAQTHTREGEVLLMQQVDQASDRARALEELATFLQTIGRADEATALSDEALSLRSAIVARERKWDSDVETWTAALLPEDLDPDVVKGNRWPLGMERQSLKEALEKHGPQSIEAARAKKSVAFALQVEERFDEAEALGREAVQTLRELLPRNDPELLESELRLASVLETQHRYRDAEPLRRELLDAGRASSEDRYGKTLLALLSLAENLDGQRRYADAESFYEQALQLQRDHSADGGLDNLTILRRLARNLEARERWRDAEHIRLQALALSRTLALTYSDEDSLQPNPTKDVAALALNLTGQERYQDAEQLWRDLLEFPPGDLTETNPDSRSLIALDHRTRTQLIENLWFQGRRGDVDKLLRWTIPLLRDERDRSALSEALTLHGALQLQMHQSAAALASLREAAEIRSTPSSFEPAGWRSHQTLRDVQSEDTRVLHSALADALWQESQRTPAARNKLETEVFTALQIVSAGDTARALSRAAARFTAANAQLTKDARAHQDLAQQIVSIDRQLGTMADTGIGTATWIELHERRRQLRNALGEVNLDLAADYPSYFDRLSARPLAIAEVRKLLAKDEALLLIVPTLEGTHVVAVSRRQFLWKRVPLIADEIDSAVRHIRCDLDPSTCERSVAAGTSTAAIADRGVKLTGRASQNRGRRSFDRAAAYRLYRDLVAPVLAALEPSSSLLIVTTGSLSTLPFSVLQTAPPEPGSDDADPAVLRAAPWLMDRFALTHLPEVNVLHTLRTLKRQSTPTQPFLGFGDPIVRDLPPLPGTRGELEATRDSLHAPLDSIYLQERATEIAFKRAPLADARVISVATHALVGGEVEGIHEPGLVFSPPTKPTAEDDGFLTASEATLLDLNAEWLILSACNTASGDGTTHGEALSGLARAFFHAGAQTLLVSHWPVRDDVAPVLIPEVLRLALQPQNGSRARTRAHAFQRAMYLLRTGALVSDDDSLAHPSAWAVFDLVGEGGGQ